VIPQSGEVFGWPFPVNADHKSLTNRGTVCNSSGRKQSKQDIEQYFGHFAELFDARVSVLSIHQKRAMTVKNVNCPISMA
jgi:hypothetical protein